MCRMDSYKSVILILDFRITKSIGFRMIYFSLVILFSSLFRLALWAERIAAKVEMVGLKLTTCLYIFLNNDFLFFFLFVLNKLLC